MSTPTLTAPPTAAPDRSREIDNRAGYLGFGFAYVAGHGAAALSRGDDPLVALPGWLPTALLGLGLAAGTVFSTAAALRAQRGVSGPDALPGQLVGLAWISGFAALFLAITGLGSTVDSPDLQSLLWPAGSGLVVGLLYLAEGAVRRNVVHYGLGTWLALVSSSALFLGTPGLFWVLAVAGGGGYAVATHLERLRLAAG